jgi:hypothetical protein
VSQLALMIHYFESCADRLPGSVISSITLIILPAKHFSSSPPAAFRQQNLLVRRAGLRICQLIKHLVANQKTERCAMERAKKGKT